ncbi:pupal cuticle protein Edg-91 [Penaeus vannamei]|uniref:pupal cuticle protein Edg-91 n=1 Tax=Penaeus vannamei TaxID=6689 RepID=UPI00387FAB28
MLLAEPNGVNSPATLFFVQSRKGLIKVSFTWIESDADRGCERVTHNRRLPEALSRDVNADQVLYKAASYVLAPVQVGINMNLAVSVLAPLLLAAGMSCAAPTPDFGHGHGGFGHGHGGYGLGHRGFGHGHGGHGYGHGFATSSQVFNIAGPTGGYHGHGGFGHGHGGFGHGFGHGHGSFGHGSFGYGHGR